MSGLLNANSAVGLHIARAICILIGHKWGDPWPVTPEPNPHAIGNYQRGYRGLLYDHNDDIALLPACDHRHPTTAEAYACARDRYPAQYTAGCLRCKDEITGDWHQLEARRVWKHYRGMGK